MDMPRNSSPAAERHREEILAATSRCLHQEGYDATTIRKIASLLNCAVGSIYRYFHDKNQILSIVTQRTLQPVAACLASGGSLHESIRQYHQIVTQTQEIYRLMFWLECRNLASGQDGVTPGANSHGPLPQVVEKIIEGWAAQTNAVVAQHIWAVVHGFVLMGRDVNTCIAAVDQLVTRQGVRTLVTAGADSLSPVFDAAEVQTPATTRRDMPEIVITMTEPPAPRSVSPMAEVTSAEEGKPKASGEDVCLL
jgi:AcrR family transcriptional regulator